MDPKRQSPYSMTSKRRACLMLWLVLACCQSTGAHAQNAAEIDACRLLSVDEIAVDVGWRVLAPERKDFGVTDDGAYSSVCIWKAAGTDGMAMPDDAPAQFVILNAVRWPAGKNMARNFLDAFYAAAEKGDIPRKPVARALGDDALWWGDGLAVRQSDVSFGISVFPPSREHEPGKIEEALARRILTKIRLRTD
jgi:hypothetical protein